MTDGARSPLRATYDLSYRPQPSSSSFYCLDILYRSLAPTGRVEKVENYRGAFRRDVHGVRPGGGVVETITWRHVGRRERPGDGAFGDWQRLEWADGFRYPFSAEDGYDDFHWSYASFPRGEDWLLGWNVLLLTVDAHFEFDFLRSRRHGAIHLLGNPGDSVIVPDSDEPFWLGLPPAIEVPAFTKRRLRSTFLGLGRHGDVDCGVVAFGMDVSPFQMVVQGKSVDASSIFRGTLHVALADGALEHGEFDEFVVGGRHGAVSPRYEIARIAERGWEQGTFDVDFD